MLATLLRITVPRSAASLSRHKPAHYEKLLGSVKVHDCYRRCDPLVHGRKEHNPHHAIRKQVHD